MNTESRIPNSAFDMEYSTQWRDEVSFLAERGIFYSFRKKDETYGITTYKYTKTVDLFITLADFYLQRKRNLRPRAKKYEPVKKTEEKAEEKVEEKVEDDTE